MKCIHCSSDTKYKDRKINGGRCGVCHRPFAFEPKTDPTKMTDSRFKAALDAVSADGTLGFTAHNLWYELDRRSAGEGLVAALRRIGPGLLFVLFIVGFFLTCVGQGNFGLIFFLLFGLLIIATIAGTIGMFIVAAVFRSGVLPRPRRLRRPGWLRQARSISLDRFHGQLPRWISTHGSVPKLVGPADGDWRGWTEPKSSKTPSLQKTVSDDELAQYSFDRVIVTDTVEAAALLVANNFHFENNCAVLSIDGYPRGRQATILRMLRQNPRLQVFAIHDGSEEGCKLALQLRDPAWFPDPMIPIHDLGIRPRQAMKLKMPHLIGRLARSLDELKSTLSLSEIDWLRRGNVAELAAFPPSRLLRSTFAGFAFPAVVAAASAHSGSDISLGVDDFDWSFDSDSDSDGDSFG